MKCLALDIAMHRTGWAIGSPQGNRIERGVYETNDWSKLNADRELRRWREWLDCMCTDLSITHMAIETVFVDNRRGGRNFNFSGTQAQMMLSGCALEYSYKKIRTLEIDINHWRMRFLGLNRKPKDIETKNDYWKNLAQKVCARNHFIFVDHHDEAEAIGILDYALSELSPEYRARTTGANNRTQQDADLRRGAHES